MINYDAASKTYDHTRTHSDRLLGRFAARTRLAPATAVLDFGCGTGNYLNAIHAQVGCRCCGAEPSAGMRAAAARGFVLRATEVLPTPAAVITESFVRNVAEKNFSMFRLLDEWEYLDGLARMRDEVGRRFPATGAGETMLWLGIDP